MKLLALTTLLFSFALQAEYRAYQYLVQDKISKVPAKVVTSSLNPRAYLAYHGGPQTLSLDLLRTWICPGNTNFKKPICKSPYQDLVSQGAR